MTVEIMHTSKIGVSTNMYCATMLATSDMDVPV